MVKNSLVQRVDDLGRVAEVGLRQRLGAEGVEGRDREQGRADAVAADVEQVHGEVVVVDPAVAERVAPELGRGDEPPVGPDRSLLELLGQEREDVFGGLGDVLGQHLLAPLEGPIGLVALEQVDITLGVVTDAGEEFEPVGELDDVVVGTQAERLGLDLGLLLGREHDHRGLAGRLVLAEELDQAEAVDVGHHQVLEDHGGADLGSPGDGLGGVLAVVEGDVALAGEHPPDRLADDRLVVDEQDGGLVLGQGMLGAHRRAAPGIR